METNTELSRTSMHHKSGKSCAEGEETSNLTDHERLSAQLLPPSDSSAHKQSHKVYGLFRAWRDELICLFVALIAITATVAILSKFNDQKQPEWPYSINLTTLISIFSVILRSMLLGVVEGVIGQMKWVWFRVSRPLSHLSVFDEATRGPIGSLKYIITIPKPNLPFLAAVIATISLAIGAFTQQAIRPVPCARPLANGKASVPIAHTTTDDAIVSTIYGGGKDGWIGWKGMDYFVLPIKAAIIAGMTSQSIESQLPFTCATGNCTFPLRNNISYSTAGINSKCVDVSSKIEQVNTSLGFEYRLPNGLSLSYNKALIVTGTTAPNGSWIDHKLEYQWSTALNTSVFQWDNTSSPNPTMNGVNADTDPTFEWSTGVVSMMMPTRTICDVPTLPQPNDGSFFRNISTACEHQPMISTLPEDYGLISAVCWFYPTLQHFNGRVLNGNLQEDLIGEPVRMKLARYKTEPQTPLLEWQLPLAYTFQDPCVVDDIAYSPSNWSQLFSDKNPAVSITDWKTNISLMVPQPCYYGFGSQWGSAMIQLLEEIFTENYCTSTIGDAQLVCRNWWLGSLWNGRNASIDSITTVMAGAAKGITNRLRAIGVDYAGNTVAANGVAMQTVVCTQFNWPWLLYPVVLFIATASLLAALMIFSLLDKDEWHVWKSSVWPLVFYGLETSLRGKEPLGEKDLSKMASKMKVDLRLIDEGIRLAEEDGKEAREA